MELSEQQKAEFLEVLWDYYARAGRHDLPWRKPTLKNEYDPYVIMVSELMLQQTQVARVIPKYRAFLEEFPDANVLASATLGDVLRMWQGLGYNRRAKFLWLAAQQVQQLGRFPSTVEELIRLPGVGVNTAGAIMAYAYNQPTTFIETNVRTVYIYHFFHDRDDVLDKEIGEVVNQTVDTHNPREFYWALMDYGSFLKAAVGNQNKASKHYVKQSSFNGSNRQVRGQVIRLLGIRDYTFAQLDAEIMDERLDHILKGLVSEGLVRQADDTFAL